MALSGTVFDIFDLENTVTLKTRWESLQVIENGTTQQPAYRFL